MANDSDLFPHFMDPRPHAHQLVAMGMSGLHTAAAKAQGRRVTLGPFSFWWHHGPDTPDMKWHKHMAHLYDKQTGYCNLTALLDTDTVAPACGTQERLVDALRACSPLTDDGERRQCLDKAGWKSDF